MNARLNDAARASTQAWPQNQSLKSIARREPFAFKVRSALLVKFVGGGGQGGDTRLLQLDDATLNPKPEALNPKPKP